MNSIIKYTYDNKRGANVLLWEREPFVIGRVYQLHKVQPNDNRIPKNSFRVPGYNIWIKYDGQWDNPGYVPDKQEADKIVSTMAKWYWNNIIPTLSKVRRKQFRIHEKETIIKNQF